MTEYIEVTEELLPEIIKIENEAFSPPWSEGSLLREVGIEDARFCAGMTDGKVSGFCITHISGDEGEIYQIAAEAHMRRQGIGSALMEDAVKFAEGRGLQRLFLEVRAGNAPALALYKRCGFREIGRRRKYYVNPIEDALIMERGL